MEKIGEFHDNESENISDESIEGAALINFFVPDAVACMTGALWAERGERKCARKFNEYRLFKGCTEEMYRSTATEERRVPLLRIISALRGNFHLENLTSERCSFGTVYNSKQHTLEFILHSSLNYRRL